jgi:hypothetical protein
MTLILTAKRKITPWALLLFKNIDSCYMKPREMCFSCRARQGTASCVESSVVLVELDAARFMENIDTNFTVQ